MKRILITGVGGDVARGIVQCLHTGMPSALLYGCDIVPLVSHLSLLQEYFIVPRYTDVAYWHCIKRICIEYNITHYFPSTEPEILLANDHRSFFEQQGIHLIINNPTILRTATSKYKTAQVLAENDILAPKTYILESLPQKLNFPLVVKPDYGRGSAQVCIVNDEMELKKALEAIHAPVIQEYIGTEEQEYTVGVFSHGEDTRCIAYRRKLGMGSQSVFVETANNPVIDSIVKKCTALFSLNGCFNIQMRMQSGQYYIFEINPRISSTVAFRHQMGFCDVIWWIQMISGEAVDSYVGVDNGIIGLKYAQEQILYPPFSNIVQM